MKNHVFVPHLPTRHDPVTKSFIPTINLQPATKIGSLFICNDRPNDAQREGFEAACCNIEKDLENITRQDFVMMVGDASLCAFAVHIALKKTGQANMLRWNRDSREYDLLQLERAQ